MRQPIMAAVAALLTVLCAATTVVAQTIGTFRWQLQPYCNVITLTVAQHGSVFTLDGFDDQCGAETRASASGTGVLNPNGTVALGINIVSAPGAVPVHVAVPVSLATLGGQWRDSAGQSGAFVFTPGAGSGGGRRPSSGTLGLATIDTSQVQARVSGECVPGEVMTGVNQNGSVSCVLQNSGGITSVITGPGLLGDTNAQSAFLSLRQDAAGAFDFGNDAGVVSKSGNHQLIWHAGRHAFRAARMTSLAVDPATFGEGSVAFGTRTVASGVESIATGNDTIASGARSVAMGFQAQATGNASVALGSTTAAHGITGVALGFRAIANADGSFVFGDRSTTQTDVRSDLRNQFIVRAAGGTAFWSSANTIFNEGPGVVLFSGASEWAALGPADARENFRDMDGEEVLGKIAQMPVRSWNYKAQDVAIRHAGPTSEDFHAAFGLGHDDRRISTTDADGVAFAAVKALDARTRELMRMLTQENEALRTMVLTLSDRLERLERLNSDRLTVQERR